MTKYRIGRKVNGSMIQTYTTDNTDRRRGLIIAVLVAAVMAAIVWYGLFGRATDTTETDIYTPTELADTGVPFQADNALNGLGTATDQSLVNANTMAVPQVAGDSVPAAADTGAGTFIILTAIAATLSGAHGLRRAYTRTA